MGRKKTPKVQPDQDAQAGAAADVVAAAPGSDAAEASDAGSDDEPKAKKESKSKPSAKKSEPAGASVELSLIPVKSLKNMVLQGGFQMVAGQVCEIPREEFDRLSQDERGPFWE